MRIKHRTYRPAGEPRLRHWWRSRIDYPYAGQRYRSTEHLDMLTSLRGMMVGLSAVTLALIAILGAAFVGYAVPEYVTTLLSTLAPLGVVAVVPSLRHLVYGLALSSVRKQWAEAWLEAGVGLPDLWRMFRSPISPEAFAAYREAFGKDKSAQSVSGIDPRIVWALHERNVSPEGVSAYAEVGINAETAILLAESRISVEDWTNLRNKGIVDSGTGTKSDEANTRAAVGFINWVRSSKASLYPWEFDTDAAKRVRTVDEVIGILQAWSTADRVPLVQLSITRGVLCPEGTGTKEGRCDTCGAEARFGHSQSPIHRAVGDWHSTLTSTGRVQNGVGPTVRKWCEDVGRLAPFFVGARIAHDEACQMVQSEEPPSEGALELLAALA